VSEMTKEEKSAWLAVFMGKEKTDRFCISSDGGKSIMISFDFKSEAIRYLERQRGEYPVSYRECEVVNLPYYKDWSPLDSLDQMMECVESWIGNSRSRQWEWAGDRGEYYVTLDEFGHDKGSGAGSTEMKTYKAYSKDSLKEAIFQTLQAAVGGGDE